ncbi:MAG TPA: FKBP-type peptidyl-prolyl cis-trans isomerase [Bacteroidia bacterium]|nr:FKBP-type peptidyl-prolyl cis-trans isomerase [Bacteroidia bacterium]
MIISDDKAVSVNYHLSGKKGAEAVELIEETSAEHPFVFLFGFGSVLPLFESNLAGKQKGDRFEFSIPATEGYGLYEKDYVIALARTVFEVDGQFDEQRIQAGREVEMNDADGNPLLGRVMSVNEKEVVMDFNHPLAGYELYFKGEILDVREATQEELDHGHVHGPHGHHH